MEDYKYLGSIFHYVEKGMEFKVSFKCKEEQDPETGLMLFKVENIQVYKDMKECSDLVDMEKLTVLCELKAINKFMTHIPPSEE